MQKRSFAVAAGAVFAAVAALTGTSASAIANPNSPGTVTPTQQIVETSLATPVMGDFDGDGRDDVFWYVPGSGTDYLWSGKVRNDAAGAERFDVTTISITGSYKPVTGDFNGDDRDDILWYSPGSGPDSVWYFTGRGTVLSKSLTINGNYQTVVDDFDASDGLGAEDIFLYNDSSSYLWTSNVDETFSSTAISDPPDHAKVYVGNFRQTAVTVGAPEYKDLFFYVAGKAPDAIWAGNGDGQFTKSAITVNGEYNPIIGNFDSNASGVDMTDIFWYGPGVAADSVWMNNGTSFTSQPQTVNGRYSPVLVPSREATTQDDIFWDSKTAGDFLWATNGTGGNFAYASMTPGSWGGSDIGQRSAVPGDFNAADALSTGLYGSLTSGGNFSCALTSEGAAKCWGYGSQFQLGNGTTTSSQSTPTSVTGLTSAMSSVDAGANHACAVTDAGAAKCWGQNGAGQLGNGTTTNASTPVNVSGLSSGVATIGASEFNSCALLNNGTVKCWGVNSEGELGNGNNTNSSTPVTVSGLTGVTQLDPGAGSTSCAVASGAAKCWGFGSSGRLGNGANANSNIPVTVSGLSSGVAKVVVGGVSACALTTSGGVKCWGSNSAGHLGNGTNTDSNVPVNVTGLTSGVANIFGGSMSTCALLNTGVVKCWGANTYGQLSTGNKTDSNVPVTFAGLTGTPIDVSVGFNQTCVLSTVGRIQCVGDGTYGGLGDGTRTSSLTPTEVAGGRSFGDYVRPAGNADVLWWAPGDATGQSEILWYDLDSLN